MATGLAPPTETDNFTFSYWAVSVKLTVPAPAVKVAAPTIFVSTAAFFKFVFNSSTKACFETSLVKSRALAATPAAAKPDTSSAMVNV